MTDIIFAFDDFVDECFLENDSLCKYENKELDQVVADLVEMDQDGWNAFQDLAA